MCTQLFFLGGSVYTVYESAKFRAHVPNVPYVPYVPLALNCSLFAFIRFLSSFYILFIGKICCTYLILQIKPGIQDWSLKDNGQKNLLLWLYLLRFYSFIFCCIIML